MIPNLSEEPAVIQPGGQLGTLSLLLGDRTPWVRRALTAYAAGQMVWAGCKQVQNYVNNRRLYTVSVAGSDPIYTDVHAWLIGHLSEVERRSLVIRSAVNLAPQPVECSDSNDPSPSKEPVLRLLYDGSLAQSVTIDGHSVTVSISKPEGSPGAQLESDQRVQRWLAETEKIVFTMHSVGARDATLNLLERLTEEHYSTDRQPGFWIAQTYGWSNVNNVPVRPLDTVVLGAGQQESLIADVEHFLAHERDYVRLGQPWHRGYLLQGPPGTGKTSLAKALAHHFRFEVYYLPLSDLDTDTNLLGLVSSINPRSMLLIEDIDVAHAATDRDDKEKGVTLSGLLNALDGMATPHGLITVMTTNHPDRLDPALVRSGRVDVTVDVDLLNDEQLGRLVEALLGRRCDLPPLPCPVAPSDVSDVLKRHIGDPDGAIDALREFIEVALAPA